MRADEHEGTLNDSKVKREKDRMESRALEIMAEDLRELSESQTFLRWFQRYAYPMLIQDFPVNNGSLLAHFMGRRQMVQQIVAEMDLERPGFLSRVLRARDDYEADLRLAARKE